MIRNIKKRERKAQEEIVGFALIIVLVSVIVLIFLAVSIRKPQEMRESKEIENFLHSSLIYTTSCQHSIGNYNLKDLIGACFSGKKCLNGENACRILNETAANLIKSSFSVGDDLKYKGYVFKIYYGDNILLYLTEGKSIGSRQGSEAYFYNYDVRGNLYTRLELFY